MTPSFGVKSEMSVQTEPRRAGAVRWEMLKFCRWFTALVFLCSVAVSASGPALTELITNGDFETGDFQGWNVDNQAGGSGTFLVASGTITPISGFETAGPAGGTFYGLSDQTGPGAHALSQMFTVPSAADSVLLSFDMFVNDQSEAGPIVNPAGLDYTAIPNQHARVDILSADAPAFDTGAGVLRNFYLSVDPGPNPHAYTHYEFDITDLVGAGGTFRLRFAEVDNQLYLHVGVDNVSVQFAAAGAAPQRVPVKKYRAVTQ
jgi:hypothetical protein